MQIRTTVRSRFAETRRGAAGRAMLVLAFITVVLLLTAWAFATSAHLEAAPLPASPAVLALPTAIVAPNAAITVAVTLDPAGSAVASVDLRITYDPAVITVTAVSQGGLISAWASAVNQATPGVISAALAGAQPVTTAGELLLIQFRAVGAAGASSALIFTRGDLNEGSVAVTLGDGRLQVHVPTTATPTPSITATPTVSTTPQPASTATASASATAQSTSTATATPPVTATPTVTATRTPVATSTSILTSQPTSTATATPPATATATAPPTPTSTATATNSPEPTVTPTSTATSTPEPTATPTVTPGFTVTPTSVGTAVVDVQPEAGATVAFANQDNLTTTIEVPPNAVTTPIQLVYTDLPAPDGGSGNLQLAGRYFRLTAYQAGAPLDNFTFQIPIRMVIEYQEADLGDIAEDELELRSYDTTSGEWRTDGIVVEQRDLARNLITVAIAHLSEFALTGAVQRIFLPVVSR